MPDDSPLALLESATTRVRDPVTGRSVWLAGMVKVPRFADDVLEFDLAVTSKHPPEERRAMADAIRENLRGLGYEGRVNIGTRVLPTAPSPKGDDSEPIGLNARDAVVPHGGPVERKSLDGVRHVLLVASGKGGVGKSTVATNLAIALQREGARVGLLDADVYGPSLPRMMNVSGQPMIDADERIVPPTSYGIRCLSAGLLVPEDEAIVWRGPMVMNLIRQFLQNTRWGDLDYLLVDLPPGTGDAQLTLIQGCDVSGAVVVTTPQDVALADAVRGITMFRKLEVPILGVVENMAYYELPDGSRDFVFGEGGGEALARRNEVPLLGRIPLQTLVRAGGDQGLPVALGQGPVSTAFGDLARKVMSLRA